MAGLFDMLDYFDDRVWVRQMAAIDDIERMPGPIVRIVFWPPEKDRDPNQQVPLFGVATKIPQTRPIVLLGVLDRKSVV